MKTSLGVEVQTRNIGTQTPISSESNSRSPDSKSRSPVMFLHSIFKIYVKIRIFSFWKCLKFLYEAIFHGQGRGFGEAVFFGNRSEGVGTSLGRLYESIFRGQGEVFGEVDFFGSDSERIQTALQNFRGCVFASGLAFSGRVMKKKLKLKINNKNR